MGMYVTLMLHTSGSQIRNTLWHIPSRAVCFIPYGFLIFLICSIVYEEDISSNWDVSILHISWIKTVEQLVRNLHNRIHVPFSSSEVYPVWTDLIWPGLWAANFGESLTVFQDTQHAERTRGDLKRRESGLRSAMGIAVAHDGTRIICHRLIRGRTDNNEAK